MRMKVLACLLLSSATVSAEVEINFLEWGYLPEGYKARFEAYAKSQGMNVTLNKVEPFITDFDSVYNALRKQQADVVMPTSYFFKTHDSRLLKVLLPLDLSKVSNYQFLKSEFKNRHYDIDDAGNHYALPHTVAHFSLAYDSEKIDAPDSWRDLYGSQLKQSFRVYCDQFEPLVLTSVLANGMDVQAFTSGEILKDSDMMASLRVSVSAQLKNADGFWFNQVNDCDDLKNQTVATTWGLELTECNAANNQKWRLATLEEGNLFSLDSLSLGRHLENNPEKREAAYLLVDFLMSEAHFQRLLAGLPSIEGSTTNVDRRLTDLEVAVLPDQPLPTFDEEYLIPYLPTPIKNRYKRLVREAMATAGVGELSAACPWDMTSK
ncbi:ABC transporter substrate-binding protein [Thaumasiovibrio subtropicus]|uniref:ABC transporter substrate-binding protein n=1 Tax=Thaumasiovibrio subtropicus TaxID=1891207 RepID=UPI000D367F57|nr:ABC transporter substrate-binding protein [Thaumasiovibrio subtropicus]